MLPEFHGSSESIIWQSQITARLLKLLEMEKNQKAQKMNWTTVYYAQYGEKFQSYNLALVLLLSRLFWFDLLCLFAICLSDRRKQREYCIFAWKYQVIVCRSLVFSTATDLYHCLILRVCFTLHLFCIIKISLETGSPNLFPVLARSPQAISNCPYKKVNRSRKACRL